MYDDVYESLVQSGNAEKSNEFSSEYDGPFKTNFKLTHPENCLVVDEVGSNISQKGDGHIAGKKYVCEIDSIPKEQASHTDKHFTLLGFTALSGEPVLCLIIIAGIKQMYEIETGIDIDATPIGDPNNSDYFVNNRGKGKLFPMGPDCVFNGKTIPCMVRWSQSGSITSDILRDALATIDHYKVMNRSEGKLPFLLLDGHGSRFELPFLEYITDADHKWMVCIGVPYGTSLWQVADSKEQNGSFKIAMSKIKSEILKKRLNLYMDHPNIQPTDIIPCVNYAWEQSFARVETNKKAIADRGWGPLNFNLLNNDDIKATMTDSEREELFSLMKQSQHGLNNCRTPNSIAITTSTSQHSTISDLTLDSSSASSSNVVTNYNSKYMMRTNEGTSSVTTLASKMNFKTGRSAFVVRTLLHKTDLNEAREENQKLALNGREAKKKLDAAKKLTAMLNFRNIGCKIGQDRVKSKKR